ncbi:MAG: glutamyl-tRNA reductase [Nitrospira sp.]|nr:MAG: glutamyl-tRNA reductase [Nitrospira sp.]
MTFIVVGLSHKTAPIEVREMLAIPPSRMDEALERLIRYPGIKEGLLLSTCNRVEVYAVVEQAEAGYAQAQEFLADTHLSLTSERLTPHLYRHADDRAMTHLFRVASSLDSMIVGEPQILGQIKDAFESALTHKTTGVILNKVARKAISVAKQVRTQTKIAENAVSVSFAAVELARKIFSTLRDKSVLLVGAGEMAKLAAKHLIAGGVGRVMITTRDSQHALDLAQRFNGTPIPFDQFRHEMAEADIVLCSTGASHYLIRRDDVQAAVRRRMNRPIFLIDISVPRNIDPAVKDVDNAFLFDIDDLELRVEHNLNERRGEAMKAERMVLELEVTPTIVELRKRADDIKQGELEKALAKLANLSPQERNAVEALASGIVNKLLHGSLVTLKAEAESASGAFFVEAARRFFNLNGAAVVGPCTRVRDGSDELSVHAEESEGAPPLGCAGLPARDPGTDG